MASSRLQIELGPPAVVGVSAPGEDRWGFFQFPGLWRGHDGQLYVSIHVGADSIAGCHEPTQFFVSHDEGRSWTRIDEEHVDRSPQIVTLPDGSQVAFGDASGELSLGVKQEPISANELGLMPVCYLIGGYEVNECECYRYADIPEELRYFPLASRPSPDSAWEPGFGTIEMPDLLLGALVRAMWWDDDGQEVWVEQPPQLTIPLPEQPLDWVTVLPDGTLLWAYASQHPALTDRFFLRSVCLASQDGGHTWRLRGIIADDPAAATRGYDSEQSLARMPNGDLLCIMRTRLSNNAEDTHYLAAARSTDDGYTWSAPFSLAEFCVTPHLLVLQNGLVALVYGRPGVHIRASADSGQTWSESLPLVGPSEAEWLAQPLEKWWAALFDHSCANTSVVITGPDRFLVAYSDFQYTGDDGKTHKAIKVQEVKVVNNEVY